MNFVHRRVFKKLENVSETGSVSILRWGGRHLLYTHTACLTSLISKPSLDI
jgi:hypothetical protein